VSGWSRSGRLPASRTFSSVFAAELPGTPALRAPLSLHRLPASIALAVVVAREGACSIA